MKRFTWVPVVASVVLLLAAAPLFADDFMSVFHFGGEKVQSMEAGAVNGFPIQDSFGSDFDERGASCGSSSAENPF